MAQQPHKFWLQLHVGSIAIFTVLGLYQFLPLTRRFSLKAHGNIGWLFFGSYISCIVSAAMLLPIGGGYDTGTKVYVLVLIASTGWCMWKAQGYARTRDIKHHRQWILRGFGLSLSVLGSRLGVFVCIALKFLGVCTFHAVFSCDEIMNAKVVGIEDAKRLYGSIPQTCLEDNTRFVVLDSNMPGYEGVAATARASFGSALWVSSCLIAATAEWWINNNP
jgi:hypothetical protein